MTSKILYAAAAAAAAEFGDGLSGGGGEVQFVSMANGETSMATAAAGEGPGERGGKRMPMPWLQHELTVTPV